MPALRCFGLTFADKVVGTRAEGLAALASGEADAGFLVTYTLLPSPDAPSPPVRPILTFGAARNPGFPAVPTLKERSGNSGAAITTAIALFAPRDMPQATVAAVMEAMERVAAEPEIQKAAASHHFPLEVRPAAAVMAAMARSERLIKAHAEYLDR
jgi:tripartite-type tricarboxylate transporter receptor subunit TctC